MNILRRYIFNIEHFSVSDMKKILDGDHPRYTIERRGHNIYFIINKQTNEIRNLRCISKYYTINEDGKPIKLPNNTGKCYNCKQIFDMYKDNTCRNCHEDMLEKFLNNEANLIQK